MMMLSLFHVLWLLFDSRIILLAKAGNEVVNEGSQCGLWWAESTKYESETQAPPRMALYAGIDFPAGSPVVEPEFVLSVTDANKNEWSPWHDVLWESTLIKSLNLETQFLHDFFIPGLASLLPACPVTSHSNVRQSLDTIQEDRVGVHRFSHPSAGSLAYRFGFTYKAQNDIAAGEELFVTCDHGTANVEYHPSRPLDWLEENGSCLDTLAIKPSTVPGVGRGAFSKKPVSIGQAIAVSPVVHLHRSQMYIYEQSYQKNQTLPFIKDHGIHYSHKVKQHQLLLNYCYGHPDSDVLLLPVAPGVNFINHHQYPNAYIRWTQDEMMMREFSHYRLLGTSVRFENNMTMEIVALRNIEAGEEILLDYGNDWVKVWKNHVQNWSPMNCSYFSAADFVKRNDDKLIRTQEEQSTSPYPENLRTACYLSTPKENISLGGELDVYSNHICTFVRPCDILERTSQGKYKATVYPSPPTTEQWCGSLPMDGITATDIPEEDIILVDKQYSTDAHMLDSFRHEIGVPETFYPPWWMAKDERPQGDFIQTPLRPGQLEPIRWSNSGNIVTQNAYRIGLKRHVREVLTNYCNAMGITDIFRHVTMQGNAIKPGTQKFLQLDGEQWYLQRPEAMWRSNLQWLSPGGKASHEHYLQALSVAGFDEILQAIGNFFDFEGLVVYQVTFIAVSQSTTGYLHHDFTETGAKAFNCIIPLLLANETGPELDLQDDEETNDRHPVGRYRYEYEVASMMGDDSIHASTAVNYGRRGEMRMAATVYIADVDENNVDSIMTEYTQEYPPRDRDLLLSWAGRHWNKNDSLVKLPKPDPDHILVKEGLTSWE